MCTRFWWENSKERDHSEDQGMDGIRMDLGEIGWEGVELIQLAEDKDCWQAQRLLTGSCECGDEPLGSSTMDLIS
jgi:hypothetical protein